MKGWYLNSFIPNRLCYVYKVDKDKIYFLAFFKEKGGEYKAHKHEYSKKNKKDFKKNKNFIPDQKFKDMIQAELDK